MQSLQETALGGGPAIAKTANYVLVAADAGTTVAMNAAGSTTITVNTGLFAAGDTVFIQNLGAGDCTVTAGTATVATAGSLILPQNDAGILYFTSASAAIFYDYIQAGATSPLTTKGDLYTYSTSDARLPVGSNDQILVADSSTSTGLKWAAAASSSPASASATVATNQGTTSFPTYVDLTTAGPEVTLTTGTKALVIVSAQISQGASDQGGRMSFAVSGASTITADDARSWTHIGGSSEFARASTAVRLSTLTAGSNTFTAKYATYFTTTASFRNREIIVIDLGS